jgi:WD40 repeat protein
LLSSVLRSSAAVDVTRFEPTQRVLSLAASSSGGLMAAGLDDGGVVFWRPGSPTQSSPIRLNRGAPVFEAQFSPDNTRLAVIAGDTTYLLRSSDGSVLRRFGPGTSGYAIALDWASSGRLQVASSRGTVFALDPRTGREVDLVGTVAVGGNNPLSAALDGTWIATAHEAGALAVANAATSIGRVDEVGVAKVFGFSPDGPLITSDDTTDVVLRDPGSLRVVKRLEQHAARVTAATASPVGHYLASGDVDGLTVVWDLRSGQLVETLEGHSGRVSDLAFSPDGETLTSSSHDGTAISWDLTDRQRFGHLVPASRLTPSRAPVLADADVVHPGRFRRPGVGDGAQIVSTRLDIRRPLVRRAGIGPLTSVRVSPDRRAIFVGGRAGEVVGLDVRTGRLMGDRLDLARPVRTIELAPGGARLAVGTATGVTVVDAATMHRQARVDTPAAVDSVAFSPDGHALAIGRHDGVVTIGPWERSQRPVRVAPVGLGWPAISLGWSADGRKIAVGSLGGTVHVADTRTGRRTGRTISAHSGYVLSVDVSADRSMLLTAPRLFGRQPRPDPYRARGVRCAAQPVRLCIEPDRTPSR